jgi:DNA polymerase-3 subunit alpha
LLKALSKPEDIAKKCKDNGYLTCGIADYKTISGAVSFYKACKKYGIKPIIGCSFDEHVLFAKNKDGWKDLISLVSSIDSDGNIDVKTWGHVVKRGNLVVIDKKSTKLPVSYYVNKEDVELHRILLCSELKTTLPQIHKRLKKNDLSPELVDQFTNSNYYILSSSEASSVAKEAIEQTKQILDQCEEYDILNKPALPKFSCPNGLSEEDYLKQLCRDGWKTELIENNKVDNPDSKSKYLERFKEEFDVIKGANLFGYFLIVRDIINYVNNNGWLSGPGRGSAAGCLISYLIGITKIDPVEYDLLFERFYNAGRNVDDHISLPDIDIDVPSMYRDNIIGYVKEKYGQDHVSQMVTFGRLQGRSAIKEVLRVYEACSFSEMNAITKSIPNEAEISDQLADMDDEDRSIIRWALINNSDELRDFCYINEEGKLDGNYAEYFEKAINIEGTFKTHGRHAAGVVISSEPLHKVCPMITQKDSNEKIAGLEMSDLEALGHVKFDILGITLLDKLMKIEELTR